MSIDLQSLQFATKIKLLVKNNQRYDQKKTPEIFSFMLFFPSLPLKNA